MEALTEQGLLITTPGLEIMNQNLLDAFEIETDTQKISVLFSVLLLSWPWPKKITIYSVVPYYLNSQTNSVGYKFFCVG